MGNLQILKKGKDNFFDRMKLTLAYQNFQESRYERDFGDDVRYSTAEKVDAVSMNFDIENKRLGNLRLYYGGEYVYNKVGSDGYTTNIENGTQAVSPSRYPDGASWQSAAAYLNTEFKVQPNLNLLSGIRYSHVWIAAEFDRSFYPFPFEEARLDNGALTASLGMSWLPRSDLQLTINGATGFRSPNIDDVGKVFDSEPGSVVVPNPALDPEYAYSADIGIMKNFDDKLVLRGTAFYTYLADALVRRDFT
jgi:hemoglobin/transferrin/lactoferrin receptor protein